MVQNYARQCVNTPWTQGPCTYSPVFPVGHRDPAHTAPCSLLLPWHYYFAPSPYRSSCLRSPLQLTNPDRDLLFATGFNRDLLQVAGSLLVFYVTPQLFRPFTSPLFSFTGPLPSSRVPSYLSWSPSIFTGPVLSFTGPFPSSRVPSYLSRSPSIFTGPVLSFTGPLQFSQVPFHFRGSPPLLHGSLLSSWDPSDESIWVSKPSSQLLSHMSIL